MISTPEGLGGAEQILTALLAESERAGVEQLVLNPFANVKESPLRAACLEAAGGARFAAMPCSSLRGVPALRRRLRNQLEDFGPDLVHAHLFHAEVLVASLASHLSASTLLTHHHGDHNVAEGRRTRAVADRWAGRRFHAVVAISDAVRRFLTERFGYPDELVKVIRNGWSGQPLPPSAPDPSSPVIVCVARLREQKGHDSLLRAFASIVDRWPRARLRLIGDGPLMLSLLSDAKRMSIDNAVEFAGQTDDVWPELASASVFVLPSRYEPLGIAVMEAMAAGTPVVATAVGGIPEVVGDAGLLVEPGNDTALADALVRAISDSDWRIRASREGQRRAASMRVEEMCADYLGLYQALITSQVSVLPRGLCDPS